jgi:hypothetical protein
MPTVSLSPTSSRVSIFPVSAPENRFSNGFFNTIVSPYNLSWNFHPFFIKTGLGIYLKDGYYQSNTLSSGVKVTSAGAIANNFWTFEPDLALT